MTKDDVMLLEDEVAPSAEVPGLGGAENIVFTQGAALGNTHTMIQRERVYNVCSEATPSNRVENTRQNGNP
jgi:hypothetical protein